MMPAFSATRKSILDLCDAGDSDPPPDQGSLRISIQGRSEMTMIVSPRESRAPAIRPALWTMTRGIAWVRHQLRIRQDAAKLLALSDHLLADMGVRRDQIGSAVRDATLSERTSR